jgi:hypothetical protein
MVTDERPIRILRLRGRPIDWGLVADRVRHVVPAAGYEGNTIDPGRFTGIEELSPEPRHVLVLDTAAGVRAVNVSGSIDLVLVGADKVLPLPTLLFPAGAPRALAIAFLERGRPLLLVEPASFSTGEN